MTVGSVVNCRWKLHHGGGWNTDLYDTLDLGIDQAGERFGLFAF